jgi:riboflavin biosynthesis pyrimidine reductase
MPVPVALPTLTVLLPADVPQRQLTAELGEPALAALYAHPAPADGSPWVRANMIATLDGAATGADGRSGSINGPADHRVFMLLRGLTDVVLVGAGTVRAEGYTELPVREDLAEARAARGQRAELELAVVTRSGDLPERLLDGDRPPFVLTVADRPDLDALRRRVGTDRVIAAGAGDVDLGAAVATLAARGLPRVLAEGGPRLLGDLLAQHLVDDLCLTVTPDLVGGPARRVVTRDAWFAPPLSARPAHLLHADGVLLGRWLLPRRSAAEH